MLNSTAVDNYLSSFSHVPPSMIASHQRNELDIINTIIQPKPGSNSRQAFDPSRTSFKDLKSLGSLPTRKARNVKEISTLYTLQEWEGFVLSISPANFIGLLVDKTAKSSRVNEQIEFSLSDVSEDDQALLVEGAIFRWTIGYQKQNGTKRKVSDIVFRRLPAWSRSDLEKAEALTLRLANQVEIQDGEVVWD